MGLHKPSGFVAVVELVGAAIVIPRFAHDKDIVATSEGVGEDGNGAKVDIGIIAGSLASRRSIEVPFGQLIGTVDGLVECL